MTNDSTKQTESPIRFAELLEHLESIGWAPDKHGDAECVDQGAAMAANAIRTLLADLAAATESLARYQRLSESGESLGGELEEREARMDAEATLQSAEQQAANHEQSYFAATKREIAALNALEKAEAALKELVACKELKDWLDKQITASADWIVKNDNYQARKQLAWNAARKAIGEIA